MPPRQPGQDRRDNATTGQQSNARRARFEEKQRGDSDECRVKAIEPGGNFRLAETKGPGHRRSDRRPDDRADRHQRRADRDPQRGTGRPSVHSLERRLARYPGRPPKGARGYCAIVASEPTLTVSISVMAGELPVSRGNRQTTARSKPGSNWQLPESEDLLRK